MGRLLGVALLFFASSFSHYAKAENAKQLPYGGFIVLNDIDSPVLQFGFNYRIFWDQNVCGFLLLHGGADSSVMQNQALEQFDLEFGTTPLEKYMVPRADQIIYKVEDNQRGMSVGQLKAKNGTIKETITKMNLSPGDSVILMFSRNCAARPPEQ